MPYALSFDPRLIYLIPQDCLANYDIEYEEDNFHIKNWKRLENMESSDQQESSS